MSDVHGNLTALEAVLGDIWASGITRIFNLGDLIGKGPRSAEVVDRCREVCEVIVQGNWDANIATEKYSERSAGNWYQNQLSTECRSYLAALPFSFDFTISGRRARLFHASQSSVHNHVFMDCAHDVRDAMFENTPATGFGAKPRIVGYGDIHAAYTRNFDGRTLFNAGSVGNPLDLTSASYAVLEGAFGAEALQSWALNFVRVPYDIEAEIVVAKACDMPDFECYANELRTGVYHGLVTTV